MVYRQIILYNDNYLLHLKKNSFYVAPEYYSTSINPYRVIPDMFLWQSLPYFTQKYILFTIILPKNTPAYYINFPFFRNKLLNYEMEIMLPRNSIYFVKDISIFHNIHLITLQFIEQMETTPIINPKNNIPIVSINKNKLAEMRKKIIKIPQQSLIYDLLKNSYKEWDSLHQYEKYLNPNKIELKPKKFWFVSYNPISKKINKDTLISLKKNINLDKYLLNGYLPNITPILWFVEVSNNNKLSLQHKFNYQYTTQKSIKINIISEEIIPICQNIFYIKMIAETI